MPFDNRTIDLEEIHRGNFEGLNIAGLVRLSFEADLERYKDSPRSGGEINNRRVQEEAIESFVTRRGGTYIGCYDEPDTSAYKKRRVTLPSGRYIYRVIRPVFQGALQDLKDGTFKDGTTRLDGLAVYDQDRLVRDPRELEDCIEAVEFWGRPILDIRGSLDLLTDNGRQAARHIVVANNAQSAATARRLRDSHRARAQMGIPVGGRRPFGWADDRLALDPVESEHLRKAVDDLIAGVNATRIIRHWNKTGVRTSLGNMWGRASLIALVTNPRLAGWQVHRGKMALDPSGRPIKGQHEPLVDNDTWLKVCEVVKPKRRRTGERAARRKYLLAGVIRCGVCGRRLRGAWYKQENNHYYHCVANQPGRCPGVMGSGRTIDGLVTDLVLDYLAERTVATAEETWPKAAELEAAEARTVELMAAYDAGELDGKYVFPRVQEKEEQIAKLREEQTAWLREHSGPRSTNVAEAWPSLEVEQRRAVIASVIEAVVLRRPDRPRSKFDPERLEVVWKA